MRTTWTLLGAALLAALVPAGQPVRAAADGPDPAPPALAELWPAATLRASLLNPEAWRPYPPVTDRAAWEGLSPAQRSRIVAAAEREAKAPIPSLPATLFLEYARVGNRSRFEGAMFGRRDRLHALVYAECVEDQGRFLDAIADTAWAIAEESSWTVPAHQGAQRAGIGLPDIADPVVDLFSAQTAHSMAWTLYLMGDRLDRVSPQVRPRLLRETQRRVLEPYLAREDYGWMGFGERAGRPNNWNPWINSNVLAAALLLERDEDRRIRLVHKVLRSLDRYLGPHPRDGGCDEGPNYWGRAGASLFEALEVLQSASAGRLNVFDNPVIADMGRYIYRVHLAGPWMVNVGDSSPSVNPDRALAFRYGRAIGDARLSAFGAAGAAEEAIPLNDRSMGRVLPALFGWREMAGVPGAAPPLPRDAWFPSDDMQLMVARDREGRTEGFAVAAWGSHNAQSHNHNDVGNVIVFLDGAPVLVDAGRPTYTAKTFSNQRYDIWQMQSGFHNVPTVNGVMQQAGRAFAARDVAYAANDGWAELRMQLAGAYPETAGIRSWQRAVRLTRGQDVSVSDTFSLAAPSGDVRLTFLTPCQATRGPGHRLLLTCAAEAGRPPVTAAVIPGGPLTAELERIDLDDPAMTRVWGDHLTRIVLRAMAPARDGRYVITVARHP